MGEVVGDIIPQAVGVAISPVPIIATILMLFTPRARTNAPAFAVGWVLALIVVGAIVLLVSDASDTASEETPSDIVFLIKVLIGLLFIFLAYRQWQSRPAEGEEPAMPGWMSTIESFTPAKSFGLGALLAGVNPKNLGLTLAAAAAIGQAGLDGVDPWVVLIIFVVLGSLTIAGPVIYYLLAGASAERTLDTMKAWLVANNATVMTVLFVVLGAKILGDGLGGLL
ncbi:MAG TPA: GAP family protein [Dehalococcoidia bacterium]|nr:GAP family protein [Dehalococcoidia bacterium]